MIRSLFGPNALTSMLRGGLEEASATHRSIAERVAGADQSSTNVDFADAVSARAGNKRLSQEDLQRDMAALADTQLRYEADAKLLQAAYGRLRSAMRERG